MSLRDALEPLRAARRPSDVVITTMGPAREWMALGPTHPLDFVFVPSAMGQATSLGLGLALSRPDRRVIVVNGDGSLLMNLGSLVTITAERPPNLIVLVCDNGVYEVTGSQPTPASPGGRAADDRVDFLGLARATGFNSLFRFSSREPWAAGLETVLNSPGPTFTELEVSGDPGARGPRSPGPTTDRAARFMDALRNSVDSTVSQEPWNP
jgi:thiamine pyrophosphate-dependent acetolactate synthase large subunit-like protein